MSDHKHGSMNTEVQEKTFEGFLSLATKTVIICIFLLVLIAIING